ncbi:spore coat protein U domain-containing protein [Caenimonas terrae]|uniref:Spore coat protein U domain-containing protein n=1 Tax=Caenimonas terrae TaxID=696074 RepID=A0ABW0N673_9BURK
MGVALCSLLAPGSALAAPNCFFRAVGTLSLSFGVLDPSVGTTVIASLTVGTINSDNVGNCTPLTQNMTLSAGNGLNFSGGTRRLRSGANFIPYTVSSNASAWTGTGPWTRRKPGNNRWAVIPTLTATILGSNYQNAAAGAYSDTVVLTVSP